MYSRRHSESNVEKSNSLHRLSSAIETNRTPNFVWVRFPNQPNLIEHSEPNRTQSIRLCSIEFGSWTQSNSTQGLKARSVGSVNKFAWIRFMLCAPYPSYSKLVHTKLANRKQVSLIRLFSCSKHPHIRTNGLSTPGWNLANKAPLL